MLTLLQRVVSSGPFMPHGNCYLWTPGLVWLHVVSDALITLAYYSIPITLAWFVRQRRDFDFRGLFVCFAVFILACGTTHVMEVWNVWHGNYWLSGLVKALTAVASAATAIVLVRLMPQALALPSPALLARTNLTLEAEVHTRRAAQQGLSELNAQLEDRVTQRTHQFQTANAELERQILARAEVDDRAARLAAIVEFSADAIMGKDLHSQVTSWNAGAERMFGYTAQEMVGQPMMRIIPDDRPDDEDQILGRIKQGESLEHFETQRKRKDGRLIDVSVTVSPIKDAEGRIIGASKVARDITERRRIEAALQASEGRYRTLFEHAPDGILITDGGNTVLDANASLCRTLGYTRDELIGLHAQDIVVPEELADLEAALAAIRLAAPYDQEWHFRRQDGSVFPAEMIATLMPDGTLLGMIREITERRNAEQALREKDLLLHASDRRLAEIVTGMTEACFALDKDWRFTFVNDRGQTLLHRRREEMLGQTIWETFAQLVGSPQEAHYRCAMTERVPVAFEIFSPVAKRWLDIRLFPTAEGLAAFLLDIQDRKLGEAALREREHQFRTMVNAIPQLAWTARADGFIDWYNERWYQYTGTTPAQMEGWGWQSVHDPAALPEVMNRWQQALDSAQPAEMEFPLRGANGEFRTFLTRVCPLKDAAGEVVQWLGTNTDVDALRRALHEVDLLNAELEDRVVERTAQLEAANKELEAFSYSVSHDLRAPLRAVDGFSQAVVEDYGAQLPPDGRRQLQVIRESAQKMGQLVDDLLSFSRLSRQPLKRQTVQVDHLVREVLIELQAGCPQRDVQITLGDLPRCQGDRALLQRVWVNLLSNALKYSGKREHPALEIGCLSQDDENVYFVRDNGTGFDMRYAGKLFGVFHRLHRAEDYEGTGVGLAIVQRVVHRHGGRVWAQAEVDCGATFFFTLAGKIET